jgi:hypothetical protein
MWMLWISCRQVLIPFLKPADRVVMDNLAAHKIEAHWFGPENPR